MDPEHDLPPSAAALIARQDRLEQQMVELSARFSALERQLAGIPPPATSFTSPPPPPPSESHPALASSSRSTKSFENRLGSQIFNRIGIVALLIGATWFLKLAVDRQWIGATGRVLVGLLAGTGLILWSERFRNKGFHAFSYSLKAIGTGVIYLALWAAFQLYHLLPASVALLAMVLVTAWNAYMAWSQNAELLGAYALAGGLATPLLLSSGGNHEVFLFTYLLTLDLACVLLARLRSWPRLLPGAIFATIAYFIGWYSSFYDPDELALTAVFILLISAVFASAPFYRRLGPGRDGRPTERVILEEILLPVATCAFASLALYSVLQDSGHHDLLPWLMLALSAVCLGFTRPQQSELASAIHLSLAIVLFTIAIPLKASGAWITVAWLVEGTALIWASTRAFQPHAQNSSPGLITLLSLSSASLLLGFSGVLFELFFNDVLTRTQVAFLNRGFGTAITGLAAFAVSAAIASRVSRSARVPYEQWYARMAGALTIAFNLVAIAAGVVQVNLLFKNSALDADVVLQRALAVSAFLMLYGALLLAAGFWRRSALIRWQALILLVITIAKIFVYDMRNLSQGYRVLSFLGLGALLMAISFAYQKDWLALREPIRAGVAVPPADQGTST